MSTPIPGAGQTDERFSFELAARKGLDTAITGIDFQLNDDDEYKWAATRRLYEFWKEAGRAALAAAGAPAQPNLTLNQAMDAAYPIPDTPHASVKERAREAREAFARGFRAAGAPVQTGHQNCHKCFGNGLTHADFCPLKTGSPVQQSEPDNSEVPYMIVYEDRDRENELVIGDWRAAERFEQISASWNAHLFVKIASNSRDDKMPCYSAAPASAAAQPDLVSLQRYQPDTVEHYHHYRAVATKCKTGEFVQLADVEALFAPNPNQPKS